MNQSPQKMPRAVLFDYDGVLVSSESTHLSAWMQLLADLNLPQEPKMITDNAGRTSPETLRILLNRYKPGWDPAEYDIQKLSIQKSSYYISEAGGLRLYPGVQEGLRWLQSERIPAAIVSNARRLELEKTTKLLGISDYFQLMISRDDVRAFKPDPMPYLLAATTLGFEPAECVAIEDSPTGLEAALFAKIPAATVTTNFTREVLASPIPGRPDLKPHWIGASMIEFFSWLKTLPA